MCVIETGGPGGGTVRVEAVNAVFFHSEPENKLIGNTSPLGRSESVHLNMSAFERVTHTVFFFSMLPSSAAIWYLRRTNTSSEMTEGEEDEEDEEAAASHQETHEDAAARLPKQIWMENLHHVLLQTGSGRASHLRFCDGQKSTAPVIFRIKVC